MTPKWHWALKGQMYYTHIYFNDVSESKCLVPPIYEQLFRVTDHLSQLDANCPKVIFNITAVWKVPQICLIGVPESQISVLCFFALRPTSSDYYYISHWTQMNVKLCHSRKLWNLKVSYSKHFKSPTVKNMQQCLREGHELLVKFELKF